MWKMEFSSKYRVSEMISEVMKANEKNGADNFGNFSKVHFETPKNILSFKYKKFGILRLSLSISL